MTAAKATACRPKARPPRYYVLRVLACDADQTPIWGEVMAEVGSFTHLSIAWVAANNLRKIKGGLYVAGLMGSLEDNRVGAP